MVEHLIMADLLAMALMVGAFVVLLFRESPSVPRSATAGLMMGAAAIIRPTVLPLVLLIPVYLLIRRVGWRRAGAALAAGLLPVLGYMGWFAAVHGIFNLTNSNGLFLWSRTMSFANCAVIKPPPDLQALCPTAQPGPLAKAGSRAAPPAQALPVEPPDLGVAAPPRVRPGHRRVHPGQQRAGAAVRGPGHQGAAGRVRAGGRRGVRHAVRPHQQTCGSPWSRRARPALTPAYNLRYAIGTIKAYTGSDQGVSRYLGYHFGTRVVHVPAVLMNEYQHIVFLPGPVFGLVVLTGLVGIIIPPPQIVARDLLWVSAIIIMVLPIAEHEYTYRYVIPAVPLACIAAAIAFRKQDRKAAAGTGTGRGTRRGRRRALRVGAHPRRRPRPRHRPRRPRRPRPAGQPHPPRQQGSPPRRWHLPNRGGGGGGRRSWPTERPDCGGRHAARIHRGGRTCRVG